MPVTGLSPVFVVGSDFSGRDVLAALLASHPNIAMTFGTDLWGRYPRQRADLFAPPRLDAELNVIRHHMSLRAPHVDLDRVREQFTDAGERTYARLFGLIGVNYAARVGRSRWADASCGAERHGDELLAAYPDARIVHVVRDPRDQLASVLTHGERPVRARTCSAQWLTSVRRSRSLAVRHPHRLRMLRYEDLQYDPGVALAQVCAFIGEPYTVGMFSLRGAPRTRGGTRSPGRRSSDVVGRYRHVLTPAQIAVVEAMLGPQMRDLGYELARPHLPALPRTWLNLADLAFEGLVHCRRDAAEPPPDTGGRRSLRHRASA